MPQHTQEGFSGNFHNFFCGLFIWVMVDLMDKNSAFGKFKWYIRKTGKTEAQRIPYCLTWPLIILERNCFLGNVMFLNGEGSSFLWMKIFTGPWIYHIRYANTKIQRISRFSTRGTGQMGANLTPRAVNPSQFYLNMILSKAL